MSELEDKINGILGDSEQMAKITELARSLMGGADGGGASAPADAGSGGADSGGAGLFSALSGLSGGNSGQSGGGDGGAAGALSELGIDAAALGRIGKLMSAGSAQSSNEQALLSAMRPYLTEKRRSKMDRAMKLAKLARIAKLALGETEGDGHA